VIPTGHVAVAGGRVAVYDSVGSGPPVMLVSGGPGWSCDAILEGHRALARSGRRIVAWDQLDCGLSDKPDDHSLWTLERYAGEIEAVRSGLGLGGVHLVGQDWGAMLAIEAALVSPDHIKSLTLVSAIGDVNVHLAEAERLRSQLDPATVAMMKRRETNGKTDHPDYDAAMMEIFARHVCRLDPWPEGLRQAIDALNKPLYDHLQGPNEFRFTGAIAGWSCLERVSRLDVPCCIMVGRHGWCTPHESRLLAEALTSARLVVFEESSHFPFFEEPLAYQRTLEEFLAASD
jgi:proline iminopeptidase